MRINDEFDKRAVVHGADIDWVDSPMAGVSRRSLDRVGAEVARATTIVRYAPGSHFSPHVHIGGEEFFVLEGVFQDESGDYPAGSYIRNPPQSKHTPSSKSGCVIFVKLWQFDSSDRIEVKLNTNFMKPTLDQNREGVSVTSLYFDEAEEVSIHDWQANANITIDASNGIEVLVLDGTFEEEGDIFKPQSWLRLPLDSMLKVKVGANGAKVWIKQHHLNRVDSEVERINAVDQ